MNFEERFLNALGELVSKETGDSGVEVTSYDTTITKEGFCDTCSYDVTIIEVYYTSDNRTRTTRWTFRGGLGELMRALTA